MIKKPIIFLIIIFHSSCGVIISRDLKPDLLANEKFHQTNASERGLDVHTCLDTATQNVKVKSDSYIVGKSAFYGALIGTAPGAVSGTIIGDTPQSTAVGAASGLMVGILQGIQKLYEGDPVFHRFVEHCLHKKGYEITGWSA